MPKFIFSHFYVNQLYDMDGPIFLKIYFLLLKISKETPSKVLAYFRKNAEIFSSGLADQTFQKTEFSNTNVCYENKYTKRSSVLLLRFTVGI